MRGGGGVGGGGGKGGEGGRKCGTKFGVCANDEWATRRGETHVAAIAISRIAAREESLNLPLILAAIFLDLVLLPDFKILRPEFPGFPGFGGFRYFVGRKTA